MAEMNEDRDVTADEQRAADDANLLRVRPCH
jgi:hypothetical protein